jgi:hypothetical protein
MIELMNNDYRKYCQVPPAVGIDRKKSIESQDRVKKE